MKTLRLLTAALLLASCDFDVPNLNQPAIESLQKPTPSQVNALATGLLIDAHDVNGVGPDADRPLGDSPGPIVPSLDTAYTFVEALLDDAQTHLAAGGTAFPFKLGTGFTGFDTPATFSKFNRALRARV